MTPDAAIAALVARAIERHALPARLVTALIAVESGGDPWAWNPEPHYRWLWDVKKNMPFRAVTPREIASEKPPADFPSLGGDRDQEWWGQQASWGLMQVMGAVAREHGFAGLYLPELCDAETNIEHGCRHLVRLARRHRPRYGWPGVIAAYNAGSPRILADGHYENQSYVDKVISSAGGGLQ